MDHIYIDIRTCELTLAEVMAEVQRLIEEHPDQEIFMDGDGYACRRIESDLRDEDPGQRQQTLPFPFQTEF